MLISKGNWVLNTILKYNFKVSSFLFLYPHPTLSGKKIVKGVFIGPKQMLTIKLFFFFKV